MIEFLFFLAALYLTAGVATYFYCVFKTYEYTGFWDFKIEKRHIGICVYPRWLMAWMYWAAVKVHGFKR